MLGGLVSDGWGGPKRVRSDYAGIAVRREPAQNTARHGTLRLSELGAAVCAAEAR
jgi:hypothetical protein